MYRIFLFLVLFLSIFLLLPPRVSAQGQDKFVTVVNPLRSREIWRDIHYVEEYISLMNQKHISSTWLIQYDNFSDAQITNILKKESPSQELGVFLEVSEKLATDASVPYLIGDGDWARADKLLLSGYIPDQRLRMIDTIFEKFKKIFGKYPKSVGAWYIDTVSVNYLVHKYNVKAILMVADQYQTDGYGLWGMPWGVAFSPSKFNSLIPAQAPENKQNAVILQWAPRDPVLGYGMAVSDSTFSVQANDYKDHHQLDTNYFLRLANSYLSASPKVNQLTIGLEVGQESVRFLGELGNQIDSLKVTFGDTLRFITMGDFAEVYRGNSQNGGLASFISGSNYRNILEETYWYSSPYYRVRIHKNGKSLSLDDLRIYDESFTFEDIVRVDKHKKLSRVIPSCVDLLLNKTSINITDEVQEISIANEEHETRITIKQTNNTDTIIISLKPTLLSINKRVLFELKKKSPVTQMYMYLKWLFVSRSIGSNHSFQPSIRASKLADSYYFGVMTSPTKFIGFRSRPFTLGSFSFPFQTLIRFKTIPDFSVSAMIFQYFFNWRQKCTITL